MPRTVLTDARLRALKPMPSGQRYEVLDAIVPGLIVRVSGKGKRTFMLKDRFPGSPFQTRRAIGEYGAVTLEKAREVAREWHAMLAQGIDPGEVKRRDAASRHESGFSAVAELFIKQRLSDQRRGGAVASDLRRNAMAKWRDRPIASITRQDVVALIDSLSDRPAQAHNTFANLRVLFNWAIARGASGLEYAPTDRLKPKDLVGKPKAFRQRVLSDAEIGALWRAADTEGYPSGSIVQLLLLTGLRRSEAAEARWREFHPDFVKLLRGAEEPIDWAAVSDDVKLLTIPPERFKAGSSHLVPLADATCRLLERLPRFSEGDYVFTTTAGRGPVKGFTVPKRRMDRMTTAELGEAAPGWVLHDLRRTVRTRLSELRVSTEIAEMVVGHAKRGIERVYNQWGALAEQREAVTLWAERLQLIVEKTKPR
jgi:integrase